MFCPNCGSQNPDTAAACSSCGTKLQAEQTAKPGARRFKGTMMMVQPPPVAETPKQPPAAPAAPPRPAGLGPVQAGSAAARPGAFAKTMVGGIGAVAVPPAPVAAPSVVEPSAPSSAPSTVQSSASSSSSFSPTTEAASSRPAGLGPVQAGSAAARPGAFAKTMVGGIGAVAVPPAPVAAPGAVEPSVLSSVPSTPIQQSPAPSSLSAATPAAVSKSSERVELAPTLAQPLTPVTSSGVPAPVLPAASPSGVVADKSSAPFAPTLAAEPGELDKSGASSGRAAPALSSTPPPAIPPTMVADAPPPGAFGAFPPGPFGTSPAPTSTSGPMSSQGAVSPQGVGSGASGYSQGAFGTPTTGAPGGPGMQQSGFGGSFGAFGSPPGQVPAGFGPASPQGPSAFGGPVMPQGGFGAPLPHGSGALGVPSPMGVPRPEMQFIPPPPARSRSFKIILLAVGGVLILALSVAAYLVFQ